MVLLPCLALARPRKRSTPYETFVGRVEDPFNLGLDPDKAREFHD